MYRESAYYGFPLFTRCALKQVKLVHKPTDLLAGLRAALFFSAKPRLFGTGFTKVIRPLIHRGFIVFTLVNSRLSTVSTGPITKETTYKYILYSLSNSIIKQGI